MGEKLILPIYRQGVKHVLFDLFIEGEHVINDRRSVANVTKALRGYPNAHVHLFRRNNKRLMSLANVNKVILVLVSSGVLSMQYNAECDDVVLGLARSVVGRDDLAIDSDEVWSFIDTVS